MSEAMLDATTEQALDLLNRVGARQWRDKDDQWIISIPRQHARLRVVAAIEDLERSAEAKACVLWVQRRE